MSLEQLRPLKQVLLNEYGSFSDQRIKKIDSGSLFIVDDRKPSDHGADRKLFLWFCLIFANVIALETIEVTMRGGIPKSAAVEKWIKDTGADIDEHGLVFKVTPGDVGKLAALAKAIRSVVKAPYKVRAYKYVCPRTAASLERLHSILSRHWQSAA